MIKKITYLLAVLFVTNSYATEETYSVRRQASALSAGINIEVVDGRIDELDDDLFLDKSTTLLVKLGIDESEDYEYIPAFSLTVPVTIQALAPDNTVLATSLGVELEISYSPDGGSGLETDLHVYKVEGLLGGAHRYKITVAPIAGVADNVYLEAELSIDRYYDLDLSIPSIASNAISYDAITNEETMTPSPLVVGPTTNELEIVWPYIKGAEAYELEWVWVDNFNVNDLDTELDASEIDFSDRDFELNNTRIITAAQNHRITNVFAKGYLIYRVRGIGVWTDNDLDDVHLPKHGKWSSDVVLVKNTVADWLHKVEISGDHETGKNWQYQAVYAEEGKKKEIVSYFDGSLRNRQTVTKINSNQEAIVGESFYDNQGRSAIQVLPVPVNNTALKYYKGLNLDGSGGIFSHHNFDWEDVASSDCEVAPEALLNTIGASNYYSTNHITPEENWQDYVPDAGGFPYVQTRYTPDNTGRIRSQSGVGANYTIESDRATKYHYGQAEQPELDRLFGYKVGFKSRYKKNMVIDANEQISMSYLDPQGRVIATALAGENATGGLTDPSSLESLDEESGDQHGLVTTDKLNKYGYDDYDTGEDDNLLWITGGAGADVDALHYIAPLLSTGGAHNFEYRVRTGTFIDPCMPTGTAYPYAYELKIDLKDDCGNTVIKEVGATEVEPLIKNIIGDPGTDYVGATGTDETFLFNSEGVLPAGSYLLSKLIKVDQDKLDEYTEHYLANLSGDCAEPVFFEDNTDCFDELPDDLVIADLELDACYVADQLLMADVSPGGQYGATNGDPTSVFSTINILPSGVAVIEDKWRLPLDEGVYKDEFGMESFITVTYDKAADEDGDDGTPAFTPDVLDIVEPAVKATLEAMHGGPLETGDYGAVVRPEQLASVEDFLSNWKASWAVELLPYHPEFNYKLYNEILCSEFEPASPSAQIELDYISSETYNKALLLIDNYKQAKNIEENLFDVDLIPTGSIDNIKRIDPYFNNDYELIGWVVNIVAGYGGTEAEANAFKTALIDGILANYKNSGITMWQFSMKTVLCGGDLGGACTIPATVDGLTGAQQDQIWNTYKQTYLAEKRKIDQIFQDLWAIGSDPSFYNGFIGEETPTLPNISGFLNYPLPLFFSIVPADITVMGLYLGVLDGATLPWDASENTHLFAEKEKRYMPIHGLYDAAVPEEVMIEELAAEVDAEVYAQTGKCAFLVDIELLLVNMAVQSPNLLIPGSSVYSGDLPVLSTDLYAEMGGVLGASPVNIVSNATAGGILITATNAGVGAMETIFIETPAGVWNWANVDSLSMMYYVPGSAGDGTYNFQILATVNDGGTISEVVLEGETVIQIGECNYTEEACDRDERFGQGLSMMLIEILDGGLATGTDVPITTALGDWYKNSELLVQVQDDYASPNATLSWNITAGPSSITITNPSPAYTLQLSGSIPANVEIVTGGIYDPETGDLTVYYITTAGVSASFIMIPVLSTAGGAIELIDLECPCDAPKQEYLASAIEELFNNLLAIEIEEGDANHEIEAGLLPIDFYDLDSPTPFSNHLADGSDVKYFYLSADNTEWSAVFRINPTPCLLVIEAAEQGVVVNISELTHVYGIEVVALGGGDFTFTGFGVLSTGETIPIRMSGSSNTNCFKELECDDCDSPQTIVPLSCTDMYEDYETWVTPINNAIIAAVVAEEGPLSPEEILELDLFNDYNGSAPDFCETGLAYVTDAYLRYVDAVTGFDISTLDHPQYVSLAQFANTGLHYGYDAMETVVDLYKVYVSGLGLEETPLSWNAWVNTVYLEENAVCPPAPISINPGIYVTYPCEEYTANVDTVNAENQYDIYIANMEENFRQRYTEMAIESLIENLEETHTDKEYHYTLYYYDQAGNLVQTVPPKGIDRIEATKDETAIKTARRDHTTPSNVDDLIPDVLPVHEFKTQYKYNSLNQLVWQKTPDGGESYFAYDELGRLVVSQNAKQKNEFGGGISDNQQFSYTKFDELGRIREVGEMTLGSGYTFNEDGKLLKPSGALAEVSDPNFPGITPAFVSKEEVTVTVYDEQLASMIPAFEDFSVDNQRNRIMAVLYFDTYFASGSTTGYENGTFYDYDVHGNVKELIQDNQDAHLVTLGHNLKKTKYEYDLVSGNVKEVVYQKEEEDQFIHQYEYDADNRITQVQTSRDDIIWEQDAKYFYYDHGPLARTEIGNKKVQSNDYAYTIQGWLKGINSEELLRANDQGKDNLTASINAMNAKDVYGYSLHYFNNDYLARHGNDFLGYSSTAMMPPVKNLYNGNIREMYTASTNTDEVYMGTSHTLYKYDQLNRIKHMQQEELTLGNIPTHGALAGFYESDYSYDANGNLMTLNRWAKDNTDTKTQIDNFNYHYKTGTNQLNFVGDALGAPVMGVDLGDQSVYGGVDMGTYAGFNNYDYDEIGQLIQDKQEEIKEIEWKVTGKVHKIIRKTGSLKDNLEFVYDAMGNRIQKITSDATTGYVRKKIYYVRDAQGNPMSIYTLTPTLSNIDGSPGGFQLELTERNIYGSSRVGLEGVYKILAHESGGFVYEPFELKQEVGDRRFELSNHLGNVLEVISDRKLAIESGVTAGDVEAYSADVIAQSDYYPFGMLLSNTNYNPVTGAVIAMSTDYRYSFQGQEKDYEIKGNDNSMNYKYRMHDPRVGRFFAVDPLTKSFAYNSPYTFSENRLIDAIELEGLEIFEVKKTYQNNNGSVIINTTVKYIQESVSLEVRYSYNNGPIIVKNDWTEPRSLEASFDDMGGPWAQKTWGTLKGSPVIDNQTEGLRTQREAYITNTTIYNTGSEQSPSFKVWESSSWGDRIDAFKVTYNNNEAISLENSMPNIKNAIYAMVTNPELHLNIVGNTSQSGSQASNQILSDKRASEMLTAFLDEASSVLTPEEYKSVAGRVTSSGAGESNATGGANDNKDTETNLSGDRNTEFKFTYIP